MKYLFLVLLLVLCACGTQQVSIPKGFENSSGQALLIEGLRLHEQGDFSQAITFFDAAYFRFSENKDNEKMAETLSAKTLTLRRLNRLDEAVKVLEEAVKLTDGTGGVVLPLYNLAKTQQEMKNPACEQTYEKALASMLLYKPVPHFRDAVLNDMRLHLAVAQLLFKKDDGAAEQRALNAIEALKNDSQLDDFGKMVWVSGGLMGLTQYYIPLNPVQAWAYFDQAEKVIYSYPDEKALRRVDIENLRKEMPARP